MSETDDQARERAKLDAEKIRAAWASGEAGAPQAHRPGWPAGNIIRSLADIEALPEPDRTRVKRLRLRSQASILHRIGLHEGREAAEKALADTAEAEYPEDGERLRGAFLDGAEEARELYVGGPDPYAVEMARLVNEMLADRDAFRNFGVGNGAEG